MFQFFYKSLIICLLSIFLAPGMVLTIYAEEGESKSQTTQKTVIEPETGTDQNAGEPPQTDGEQQKEESTVFAKVGETEISYQQYLFDFLQTASEETYHGRISRKKIIKLQRDVGKKVVERALLAQEAKRRGIEPVPDEVMAGIKRFEEKNKNNESWRETRESLLPVLTNYFEEESVVRVLKERVINNIPEPATDQILEYYEKHPEKFTEPEKVQVWIIILIVDPSSPPSVWEDTRHQMKKILSRLNKGESFEELAMEFSNHESADNGGDLGFIHRGLLSPDAERAIDELEPGEFSQLTTRLLEGLAIFKKGDTRHPKPQAFDDIKERASKLLKKELKETVWDEITARLKEETKIEVNDEFYLPLEEGEGKRD